MAAAESAIGLAILVVLFRNRGTINVADLDAERLASHAKHLSWDCACAANRRDHRWLIWPIRLVLFRRSLGCHYWCGYRFSAVVIVLQHHVLNGVEPYNGSVYTWMVIEGIRLEIGFLVDSLTAVMITTVTFVSLMVHIYTIGYMHDDDGYQRFFSHIALFTFAMLMLVMAQQLPESVLWLGSSRTGVLFAYWLLV